MDFVDFCQVLDCGGIINKFLGVKNDISKKKMSFVCQVLDVGGIINKFLGVKNDSLIENVVFVSSSGC